jgi:O-antigen biosynthesis alpha-1,2-mannosyltransferase
MRIGIMLRHYEQHEGGVKVYTQNLLPHFFSLRPQHEYILLYQNRKLVGTYGKYPNVRELAASLRGTVLWDQLAVPYLTRREKLDVLFNPKFTVPLLARTPTVFVIHGGEWLVIPQAFPWYDRVYARTALPVYCRHADAVITVSQKVKEDMVRATGISASKLFPVHNGFDRETFRPVRARECLDSVQIRYKLPKRFILWAGQIHPLKNVERLLEAFARIRDVIPASLVLAGQSAWQGERILRQITQLGLSDRVHLPGWVSHDDLPALYSLAELFVLPSLHEGFGIPLIEAMACGCPVLTSETGSPPEVVRDAGYLVNPYQVADIAEGMRTIMTNSRLRASMIQKGLTRAKDFGWDKCASETLAVIESVAARPS